MNLFQWLTIPVLGSLAILELRAYLKNHQRIHLVRESVWLLGIGLILFPRVATSLAGVLGIGRGTDLVFYTFMLLVTGAVFHLYGKNILMRRDLVELARREAILGATLGEGRRSNEDTE